MSRLEINVTGSGSAFLLAERGTLELQVRSRPCNTTEEALTALTSTINELRKTIERHCSSSSEPNYNAGITSYVMRGLDTSNHCERTHESGFIMSSKSVSHTAYSASIALFIDFSDFTLLNKFATDFAAMENITVKRVDWHLTETTLTRLQGTARERAAENALQRARDYAKVFASLEADDARSRIKAVDVKEDKKYEQRTKSQSHYGEKKGGEMDVFQNREEMAFEPQDVVVEVGVHAKFVIRD